MEKKAFTFGAEIEPPLAIVLQNRNSEAEGNRGKKENHTFGLGQREALTSDKQPQLRKREGKTGQRKEWVPFR